MSNDSTNIHGDKSFNETKADIIQHIANLYNNEKIIYYEFLSLVTNNLWINYFLYQYKEIDKNDGWINFEKEISKIIHTLDDIRVSYNNQIKKGASITELTVNKTNTKTFANFIYPGESESHMYIRIEPSAITNLRNILIKDLNRLIRSLEIYLCSYVQTIEISAFDYIKN